MSGYKYLAGLGNLKVGFSLSGDWGHELFAFVSLGLSLDLRPLTLWGSLVLLL